MSRLARTTHAPFEDLLERKFYGLTPLQELVKGAPEPSGGFRAWLESVEGQELLRSYRAFLDQHLDAACTRLIDKAASMLMDRLEHGDSRYTEEGEAYKAELSALTVSKIFASIFDRRQLLRNQPTFIGRDDSDHSLSSLAEGLRALGSMAVVRVIEEAEAADVSVSEYTVCR